jgi:hypothetical protein
MSKPKVNKTKKAPVPATKPKAAPKKSKPSGNDKHPEEMSAPMQAGLAAVAALPPEPAKESKLALVIRLLSRPEGATIDDLVTTTGWQKHTVRAAISHALAKKRGYQIASEKLQGGKRTYKIAEHHKGDH